jgi:hypothetical protein
MEITPVRCTSVTTGVSAPAQIAEGAAEITTKIASGIRNFHG